MKFTDSGNSGCTKKRGGRELHVRPLTRFSEVEDGCHDEHGLCDEAVLLGGVRHKLDVAKGQFGEGRCQGGAHEEVAVHEVLPKRRSSLRLLRLPAKVTTHSLISPMSVHAWGAHTISRITQLFCLKNLPKPKGILQRYRKIDFSG